MDIISYWLLLNTIELKLDNEKWNYINIYIYIYMGCTYFWTATYAYFWLQSFIAVEFGNR